MNGIESIAAERRRQIEVEGWTPEHDDRHDNRELSAAAASYLLQDFGVPVLDIKAIPWLGTRIWPWDFAWFKPQGLRRNLVRAGALIAAEIDRLDRKAAILGPEARKEEK